MKKIIILVIFVLSTVYAAQAQRAEFNTILSDEFHFIAFFPDNPTLTEGDINTRYGKGYSRRWTVELPNISYEVSVVDFPDLSVEMDGKQINLFYDAVCNDLKSQYGVKFGGYTDILFDEYGLAAGGRTKEFSVDVRMYLARRRFYQVKVVMRNSIEKDKQTQENVDKFLREFVFIYRNEKENKYSYGLPESASQNLERRKN